MNKIEKEIAETLLNAIRHCLLLERNNRIAEYNIFLNAVKTRLECEEKSYEINAKYL